MPCKSRAKPRQTMGWLIQDLLRSQDCRDYSQFYLPTEGQLRNKPPEGRLQHLTAEHCSNTILNCQMEALKARSLEYDDLTPLGTTDSHLHHSHKSNTNTSSESVIQPGLPQHFFIPPFPTPAEPLMSAPSLSPMISTQCLGLSVNWSSRLPRKSVARGNNQMSLLCINLTSYVPNHPSPVESLVGL